MVEEEAPRFLYRYRTRNRGLEELEKSQAWATAPWLFTDKMDSMANTVSPETERQNALLKEAGLKEYNYDALYLWARDHLRVLCTTDSPLNREMWENYAQFDGLCLCYAVATFDKKVSFQKVQYRDEPYQFNDKDHWHLYEAAHKAALVKPIQCSFEREWRYCPEAPDVWSPKAEEDKTDEDLLYEKRMLVSMPKPCAIYIGEGLERTDPETFQRIRDLCDEKYIPDYIVRRINTMHWDELDG